MDEQSGASGKHQAPSFDLKNVKLVSCKRTTITMSDRTYEVFWSTDLTTWTSDSTHPGTGSEITVPLNKAVIDAADGSLGNLRALFVRVGIVE